MSENLLSEEELYTLYQEWFSNRSAGEYKLQSDILKYEQIYFEDMRFCEKSLCYEIVSFVNEWCEYLGTDLSSAMYRFYIVDNSNLYSGICNGVERTISIAKNYVSDKATILHEMIHAYEFILEKINPMFCEYLILALYQKLLPLVSDLDKRLAEHGEIYGQSNLTKDGGYHGLLFYLKSLDLDIRCSYKLGTVCGYGRDTSDMWY